MRGGVFRCFLRVKGRIIVIVVCENNKEGRKKLFKQRNKAK